MAMLSNQRVNQLFLWPCSVAKCFVYQRLVEKLPWKYLIYPLKMLWGCSSFDKWMYAATIIVGAMTYFLNVTTIAIHSELKSLTIAGWWFQPL